MIDLVNMKINMGHMMDERMGQMEKKKRKIWEGLLISYII